MSNEWVVLKKTYNGAGKMLYTLPGKNEPINIIKEFEITCRFPDGNIKKLKTLFDDQHLNQYINGINYVTPAKAVYLQDDNKLIELSNMEVKREEIENIK